MISKQAKILEKLLGIVNFKSKFTKNLFEKFRGKKFSTPPKDFYDRYDVNHFIIEGHNCYTLKSSKKTSKHIVFYHGGAYKYSAAKLHWGLMNKILCSTECAITFVDYPLSTEKTCVDTIDMSLKAYIHLFKGSKEEIILMGDSSGGGLSLAMAEIIKQEKIKPKPDKLLLISPWLDVSMDYEVTRDLDKNDKMLNKDLLIINGQNYAGDLDVKDFRCSPLFGDLKDVGKVALFIGTNDMLINDAIRFKEKFEKVGGDLKYYQYEGMQHDWIEFPIPEAKEAIDKIIDFIKD